jgi:hypothetical protein
MKPGKAQLWVAPRQRPTAPIIKRHVTHDSKSILLDYETSMAHVATALPDSGFCLRIAQSRATRRQSIMDLRFLSRNAESAKRSRHLQRRRGFTFAGRKIWEQSEDDVLRATATLTLSEVQKRLPHRGGQCYRDAPGKTWPVQKNVEALDDPRRPNLKDKHRSGLSENCKAPAWSERTCGTRPCLVSRCPQGVPAKPQGQGTSCL